VGVYGIQLPGRGARLAEPPIRRLHELVPPLADAISSASDMPFIFLVHSLGALVCFEVARWLKRTSRVGPRQLIVSGRSAPHLPDLEPWWHLKSDNELLESVMQLNAIDGGVAVDAELLAFMLPVLRADLEMNDTYTYVEQSPLRCPVSAFGGQSDPETQEARLDEWRAHTSGEFRARRFAGGHFYLRTCADELAAEITELVAKVGLHDAGWGY